MLDIQLPTAEDYAKKLALVEAEEAAEEQGCSGRQRTKRRPCWIS